MYKAYIYYRISYYGENSLPKEFIINDIEDVDNFINENIYMYEIFILDENGKRQGLVKRQKINNLIDYSEIDKLLCDREREILDGREQEYYQSMLNR